MNKAVTDRSAGVGFVWNGMSDEETLKWPDLDKVLNTCSRPLTLDEYNLIIDNFEELLNVHMERGEIAESTFNWLKFPLDIDEHGREVELTAQSECFLRAMCPSSEGQKRYRRELQEAEQRDKDAMIEKSNQSHNRFLTKNEDCEKKLIA